MKATKIFYLFVCSVSILFFSCKSNPDIPKKDKGVGKINIENFVDDSIDPATDFYKYATGKWQKDNPVSEEKKTITYPNPNSGNTWLNEFKNTGGEEVYDKITKLFDQSKDKEFENLDLYKNHIQAIDKASSVAECLTEYESIIKEGIYTNFSFGLNYNNKSLCYNLMNMELTASQFFQVIYLTTIGAIDTSYKDYFTRFLNKIEYNKDIDSLITDYTNYITGCLKIDIINPDDDIFNTTEITVGSKQGSKLETFIKNVTGISDQNIINNCITTEKIYEFIEKLYGTSDSDLELLKAYIRYLIICNSINDSKIKTNTVDLQYNISRYYINKYYSDELYNQVSQMCTEIKNVFKTRLQNNEWLSDEGKAKSIEKIDAMTLYIGKPKTWNDDYLIKAKDSWTCFDVAAKDIYKQQFENRKKCLANPTDENSYYVYFYSPEGKLKAYDEDAMNKIGMNAIIFLPGLLISHNFDETRDEAYNYGALGATIGHEITHGLDSNGSNYDKYGIYNPLFDETDKSKFEEKKNLVVAYYNSKNLTPNLKINGEQTLGENIADLGGIAIAYDAMCLHFKDDPYGLGLEEEKRRFFIAYGSNTLANCTDSWIENDAVTNVHVNYKVRYNCVLSQFKPWFDMYKPTADTKDERGNNWYVAPENMITVW